MTCNTLVQHLLCLFQFDYLAGFYLCPQGHQNETVCVWWLACVAPVFEGEYQHLSAWEIALPGFSLSVTLLKSIEFLEFLQ